MRALLATSVLLAACISCSDGSASGEPVSLTVRRELPAGPVWEEGSTMVVRVFAGQSLVEELHVGDDYEPAVATTSLDPGTYRVEIAQLPCSESCRTDTRDPETAGCEKSVTLDESSLELIVRVTDPDRCEIAA